MRIGGLQKTSFLDYPHQMSCVIFTVGCNFRCPFCHNKDLVIGKVDEISEKEIFDFLEQRKNILEAVVVSGGEPTMQKDIFSFIEKIKKNGYLVKLDTNGTNPDVLKGLIDKKLIDFVAMDIKNDWENYDKATDVKNDLNKIKESVRIIKESGIGYQFRSTIVRGIHTVAMVKKMKKEFPDLVLQKFRAQNCIDPKYLEVEEWSEQEWLDIVG
jgi:pyruvate formate lyase activating enzyme